MVLCNFWESGYTDFYQDNFGKSKVFFNQSLWVMASYIFQRYSVIGLSCYQNQKALIAKYIY